MTAAPTTSGTPSITKAKQPAALEGLGRVEQGAGRVDALALHPEATHGEDRLGREAEVPHHRDLGPDDRLHHGQAGPAALELDGLGPGADQGGRVAHRLVRGEVVAHPGHVAEDQAVRRGTRHRGGVVRHHVDVDVERVGVSEDRVGHRVPDEDDVGPGLRHDAGARFVVGRHHDDGRGAVAALAGPQRRDGDGPVAHRSGAVLLGRGVRPPAGYLRIKWCQAHDGHTSTS